MVRDQTCDWKKIALLIPLLGSDKDGEVVGAAYAIRRVLQAGGVDLHALSQRITAGSSAAEAKEKFEPASDDFQSPQVWAYDYPSDVIDTADRLLWCPQLNDKERQFVGSIRDQARRRYGFRLSEKQRSWLEAIIRRHGRGL